MRPPLALVASAELLGRYRKAFLRAWRDPRVRNPTRYQVSEAHFLPADLALQETPLSPMPRVAIWLLTACAALILLWSIFGRIDITASAQGKVMPSGRTKTVQALETARVMAIHVREGQTVHASDVLIELDSRATDADIARLRGDLGTALVQAGRAGAILQSLRDGNPPKIKQLDDVEPAQLVQANQFARAIFSEYQAKRARMAASITRHSAALTSTMALVRKLEQTAPITRQRAADMKSLLDEKFVSKHAYLDREQMAIEQEADLTHQRSRVKELKASLIEAQEELRALKAETERIAVDSQNDGLQRAAAFRQDLIKAVTRGTHQVITAPVSGTVQQLATHTVDGVVTSAQPLMLIVPADDQVEVEVFLENKDIGFVHLGDAVAIKAEAFPYTRYGTIPGKVSHISKDAVSDEEKGLRYAMRVALDETNFVIDGQPIPVSAGMAVTADVRTGKQRVIEYFLSPLLRYKNESLRER